MFLTFTEMLQKAFGKPALESLNNLNHTQRLHYTLAFIDHAGRVQDKELSLAFDFDKRTALSHIQIRYFKYDYYLDLSSGRGRLIVNRNK